MATIPELKEQYEDLDRRLPVKEERAIDTHCLLTFQYDYPEQDTQVEVDTEEFTALLSLDRVARLWDPANHLRAGPKLH